MFIYKYLYSNRKIKVFYIFFLMISIFSIFLIFQKTNNLKQNNSNLTITKTLNLPLREISGIGLKNDPISHKKILYAVGDNYSRLSLGHFDASNDLLEDLKFVDFTKALLDKFALCTSQEIPQCKRLTKSLTSQWEAIYMDSNKRIFMLNESFASIIVYNSESNKIDTSINFSSFTAPGMVSQDSQKTLSKEEEENSLAEGFVLLKNNHILLIKEKNPAMIIEFAIEGQEALGYTKELSLQNSHFDLPTKTISMVPLKSWLLPKTDQSCDLSEIISSDDGSLYLLSQKCHWISKLETLDVNKPQIEITKKWILPTQIKNAEAFLILEKDKKFIVAEDIKEISSNNLFILEPHQTI